MNKPTQREFWARPDVIAQQDIQKRSSFGSEAHKGAFYEMKRICASLMGDDFAEDYFGEYE